MSGGDLTQIRAAQAVPGPTFSGRLLPWFDKHGRKDLPWQRSPTPYGVWVSEIMLQQTQVSAVIPYYHRFLAHFPDVGTLADAPVDDVLHLWSGLGYYARARNLHRAARLICDDLGGELPLDIGTLQSLPGIGRSTAGAILAFSVGERHPILDGNVKRVLCRCHGIEGWPGAAAVSRRLWNLAETYTPQRRVADYTQAIMDLGATVCTRSRPACPRCPLRHICVAHAKGEHARYPGAKPRKELPVRETVFLLLRESHGGVLLERRPPVGIWGGLWAFPECPPGNDIQAWCAAHLRLEVQEIRWWPLLRHTFSHFHLDIAPALVAVKDPTPAVLDGDGTIWYKAGESGRYGLPAPVARLLARLTSHDNGSEP